MPPFSTVSVSSLLAAPVRLATFWNEAVTPLPETVPASAPVSDHAVALVLSKMMLSWPLPPVNEIAGGSRLAPLNELASTVSVVVPLPPTMEMPEISFRSPKASTWLLLWSTTCTRWTETACAFTCSVCCTICTMMLWSGATGPVSCARLTESTSAFSRSRGSSGSKTRRSCTGRAGARDRVTGQNQRVRRRLALDLRGCGPLGGPCKPIDWNGYAIPDLRVAKSF